MSDDWRITNQEKYLLGAKLTHKKYIAPRPGWDHDHCEFCRAKLMEHFVPGDDILLEGWVTEDNYRWVCERCYENFHDRFRFNSINS